MGYEEAVGVLQSLAYIVIPFDKTQHEFQLLLGRLKQLLKAQTGNVKMHDLIEAVTRLHIDTLD